MNRKVFILSFVFIFAFTSLSSTILMANAKESDDLMKRWNSITFNTPTLHMAFASPDEGMGLRSLINAHTGEEFLAADVAAENPLIWKLELTTDISKKDEFFTIDNTAPAKERHFVQENGKLILNWIGVEVPGEGGQIDVTVEISVADFHDMTDWRIHVDYDNEMAKLWRVVFPVVDFGEIGESGEDDYYLNSATDGRTIRNPIGEEILYDVVNVEEPVVIRNTGQNTIGHERPHGLPYPTGRMQMQLNAYYEQMGSYYYPDDEPGTALYMASHDSKGYPKVYFTTAYPDDGYFEFEIAQYPDTPHKSTGVYEQPYPIIFGGYEGAWFEAAEYYREWALQQPWAAKGPLVEREDVPNWLLNMNAVFRGDIRKRPNEQVLQLVEPYRDQLEGPMMIQWYNWSAKEKDPEYEGYAFPPVSEGPPGFKNTVNKLQSQDIMVFPYLNTRLWDAEDPHFADYVDHAKIRPSGEIYESSGSTEISVFSEKYKNYLVQTAREVVEKYGVKGLYLDQGGNTRFGGNWELSGSFNPNLPEHPGVNRAMVQAEHDRFQAIADAVHELDPDIVLTGESVSENFIDTFANRLTHYSIWPGFVPLFNAVYHDYATSYGRTAAMQAADPNDPRPAMQAGWLLSSGNQLGRLWPMTSNADPKYLEYVKRAVEVKDQFPQYLNFGQMLRPPSTKSKVPYIVTQEFTNINQNSHLPVLLASNWKAEDGSVLMVVTNVGQEKYSTTFSMDYGDLDMKLRPVHVKKVYPQAADPQNLELKDNKMNVSVDLDPMEIVAFRIDPISTIVHDTSEILLDAEELILNNHWKARIQHMMGTLDKIDRELERNNAELDKVITMSTSLHKDLTHLEGWVNKQDPETLENRKDMLLSVIGDIKQKTVQLVEMVIPFDFQVTPDLLINERNADIHLQMTNAGKQKLRDLQLKIHFPDTWNLEPVIQVLDDLKKGDELNITEMINIPSDVPKGEYPISAEIQFTYDHVSSIVSKTKTYPVLPPVEGRADPETFRVYEPSVNSFELEWTNHTAESVELQLIKPDHEGLDINIPEQVLLQPYEVKRIEGDFEVFPALEEGDYTIRIQPSIDEQVLADVNLEIQYDSNLIFNPGFEESSATGEGPDGWRLKDAGVWDQDEVYSGQYSVRLDPIDHPFNVIDNNPKDMPVKQGKRYEFSAWAKNASTIGVNEVGVRQIDETGTTVTYRWYTIPNESDWQQYRLAFFPHPRTETVSIYLKMDQNADGSLWMDDVELIQQD